MLKRPRLAPSTPQLRRRSDCCCALLAVTARRSSDRCYSTASGSSETDAVLRHVPLGRVSYDAADRLQERLVRALLAAKQADRPRDAYLLTAEFEPVYTSGRRERGLTSLSAQAALGARSAGLSAGSAQFREAMRGGQTTYHGPGQLVAYPVIDLLSLPPSSRVAPRPKCYVDGLESVVIEAVAQHGVAARRTTNTGVWTTATAAATAPATAMAAAGEEERKLASVGVHLRRNVTSHGVAINVGTDLRYFDLIVACGLADKKATSLHALGKTHLTLARFTTDFVRVFAETFGYARVVDVEPNDVP